MKKLIFFVLLGIFIYSCSNSSREDWTTAVPNESSFIIVPQTGATVDSILKSNFLPTLEDISTSSIQLMADIDSTAGNNIKVESIVLYPGENQHLHPIWILQAPDELEDRLTQQYARKFTNNEYTFNGKSILSLNIKDRIIYTAKISNFTLVSESSSGIENAIRSYSGLRQTAGITSEQLQSGSLIMNTPALDKWLAQLTNVKYHPSVFDIFEGTSPALLKITAEGKGTGRHIQLAGNITLPNKAKGTLLSAVSHENDSITLDEYISSNAAGFGIFHAPVPESLPDVLPDTSSLDQAIIDEPDMLSNLKGSLGTELALVTYAESGFLSTGEYLFIKKLNDVNAFREHLEAMNQQGLIDRIDGLYFAQSYALTHQLSSGMANFNGAYLNLVGDAVVIAKRKGLAELVASDRSRRRVVSYEPFYEEMKENFPEQLSGLFVAGPEFFASKRPQSKPFLEPFLNANNYLDALTSEFNYVSLTTRVNESGDNLSINISTFSSENGNRPFRENWLTNRGSAELSGPPAFGNIGGSMDNEVVFATRTGNIYAVAASDGTVVQQYNTGSDEPIGSPVVYDWYGTGQNVVLIAAGNKIYGWDENGNLLPQFPLEMNEQITTPLTITDINNNRIPDAVIGTADRKLHVLDRRGENLTGWPVSLNTAATTVPYVDYFQSGPSVIVFSSNAVHAWNATGKSLNNFPVFVNASLRGSPTLFDGTILGNGVDGKLYAIGNDIPLADSLNTYRSNESGGNIKAIDVSNNALIGTPFVYEDNILTMGQNGSIFLLNAEGELQSTKNMGQPSAQNWSPLITDINSDGQPDIVALAEYGRLYAWQLSNGQRIHNLPTAGMNHLKIGDLDSDGLKEIVAQTEEGVRCWTINR